MIGWNARVGIEKKIAVKIQTLPRQSLHVNEQKRDKKTDWLPVNLETLTSAYSGIKY